MTLQGAKSRRHPEGFDSRRQRNPQKIDALKNNRISPKKFTTFFKSVEPLVHLNLFNCQSLVALAQKTNLTPLKISLTTSFASMILFNSLRQLNRNFRTPVKRSAAKGTWQYFEKTN